MSASYQGCLFDPVSLHGGEPSLGRLRGTVERHVLADDAWVDVRRHWVAGADELFAALTRRVPWRRAESGTGLVHTYAEDEALPHRILGSARQALTNHYVGEPFATISCGYADDRGDPSWRREPPAANADLTLALLALGDPRRLLLRPRGGGASRAFALGHGDLVVMGGTGLRAWEHAVRRVARGGARIEVRFRPEPAEPGQELPPGEATPASSVEWDSA